MGKAGRDRHITSPSQTARPGADELAECTVRGANPVVPEGSRSVSSCDRGKTPSPPPSKTLMPVFHDFAAPFSRRRTAILVVAVLTLVVTDGGIKLAKKGDQARVAQALHDIDSLSKVVDLYRLAKGQLPHSLLELDRDLTTGILTDPWGTDYVYVRIGPIAFDIVCLGADGAAGGESLATDLNREAARLWARSRGRR